MKATFFTLFAAAGMVAAQNLDAIPSCALQCVMEALPDAGCEGVDIQCACKNINKIMASASDCLQDACDPEELEQAQGGATELCGGEEIPSISSSSSVTGSMTIPESTVTTPGVTVTTTPSGTPTGSETEGPTPTGGDGGDGDDGGSDGGDGGDGSGGGDGDAGDDAARPAIGLAAAALAILAAL